MTAYNDVFFHVCDRIRELHGVEGIEEGLRKSMITYAESRVSQQVKSDNHFPPDYRPTDGIRMKVLLAAAIKGESLDPGQISVTMNETERS